MNLLAIDTATEACSAAVQSGGRSAERYAELERGHSEKILVMVDEVLAEAGTALIELDGIAFGRGPGAFTGVRLAASLAQGLAFGAELPVIPVSDLRAVAQAALDVAAEAQVVLVCNDARMNEVYWAWFHRGPGGLADPLGAEHVSAPQRVELPAERSAPIHGAGRGFRIYPELAQRLGRGLERIHPELLPRAREILRLGEHDFGAGAAVSPAQALPVYLRDDVARPPSRD